MDLALLKSEPLPKTSRWKSQKTPFSIVADQGIINRMGFNNQGVDAAISRLKNNKNVIIGGNIGKNKTTPNDQAIEDYLTLF